jgi:hypothetical protein
MRRRPHVAVLAAALALAGSTAAGPAAAAEAPAASASAVGAPTPAESASRLAARLHSGVVALWNGDCARWRSVLFSLHFPTAPCDAAARARIASGFRIVGAARYGTGAVVNYVSAGHPRGYTLAFLLGPGRRWHFDIALDPVKQPGVFRGPGAAQPFDASLRRFLSAVRRGDCSLYWRWGAFTAADTPAGRAFVCRQAFGPPRAAWVRDLQANPGVTPLAFGGTRDFRFYALRTPGHLYSVAVTRYPGTAPPTHLTDVPLRRVY